MTVKTLLIILTLIFATAGISYVWNKYTPPKTPASYDEKDTWKNMDYPELGISLSLPPEFAAEENGKYSRIFAKVSPRSDTPRPSFIYFSVVPRGASGNGEVYNYNPEDFKTLISMQDGETKILGNADDEEMKKYTTFVKTDSLMLGGYGTKAFINTKPWEFPSGTTEYRFITEFGNVNYIIGGYLAIDAGSPYYISRDEFNKILAMVKFTPDIVKPLDPAQITPQWETFTDEMTNLSFTYPNNWQLRPDALDFPDGDLFAIGISGKNQKSQTELYDGASFGVMKPETSNTDLETWVQQKYNAEPLTGVPNVFSEEKIGENTFQKAYICGLGCFSYYHLKANGRIYGFVETAVGPDKKIWDGVIQRIMESLSFSSALNQL